MGRQILADPDDKRISILKNLYPEAFLGEIIDLDMLHSAIGVQEASDNGDEESAGYGEYEASIWLIPWIERRIRENRNANLVFVGDTGSGKSYSSISLAEQVDPNFSADRIVFTTRDFVTLVNSDLPKGSVIIFDDAGLGIPAREWQRTSAKIFGKLFQGFRYKNLISMITVPDISFIERQSRMLMHLYFEATDTQGIMKPFHPFHPFRGDERLGFQYPRIERGGREIQVKTTVFHLPSKNIRDAYEKKKYNYMEETNRAFQLELEYTQKMEEAAQEEMKRRMEKLLKLKERHKEMAEKVARVKELRDKGYSEREIAREVGMSNGWVHKVSSP